jgi:O-antigen ligase
MTDAVKMPSMRMKTETGSDRLGLEERIRATLLALFFISFNLPVAIQQSTLGCLLAFTAYLVWRRQELAATPLDRPLLGFFAALLLSALVCPAVFPSLVGFRKLWLVGAMFVVYHLLADPQEAWRLSTLTIRVAIGVAVYGVVQHYTGFDFGHWLTGKPQTVTPFWFGQAEGFRTEGLFPTGITYAHNMLFPLTLLTVRLLTLPMVWRERLVLLAGWGVMVLALLFSLTRGVWVAYLVVLLALGGIKGRKTTLAVGGVIVLMGVALALASPGVWERAKYAFDLRTNFGRSQIWQANVDMIKERPLLGWGYGNYKRFRDEFYRRYPQVDTTAHAHNNFLQMWVDGGLLGLGAFGFLFWSIIRKGWRAYRRLPVEAEQPRALVLGGALSIVGFLVGGLTQYNFGDAEVVIVMWGITGLLMRGYTWVTEESREKKSSSTEEKAAYCDSSVLVR